MIGKKRKGSENKPQHVGRKHAKALKLFQSLWPLTLFSTIFYGSPPRFCREIQIHPILTTFAYLFPKWFLGKKNTEPTTKKIPNVEAKQCPNEGTKHLAAWPSSFSALALQCPGPAKTKKTNTRWVCWGGRCVFFVEEVLIKNGGDKKRGGGKLRVYKVFRF